MLTRRWPARVLSFERCHRYLHTQRAALTSFDIVQDAKTRSTLAPLSQYQRLSLLDCLSRADHPRLSIVSSRDFIDNALYNPHYGYFSKNATIFEMPEKTDFTRFTSTLGFMNFVAGEYDKIESVDHSDELLTRQVWHTPAELFKPHYGSALARYIVNEHQLRYPSYRDLLIYEIGGGNGTLAVNILDYLRTCEPEIYKSVKYRIIEISAELARKQQQRLGLAGHSGHFEIINKSIFNFDDFVPDRCFILALEVIDNFAHDVVRYDYTSTTPFQAIALTNELNDYTEEYEPVSDPLLARYLYLASHFPQGIHARLCSSIALRRVASCIPFAPNLTQKEFVPTRLLQFFETLRKSFPLHKLVLSDFSQLPDTVKGINAPVVQTRYQKTMVPVSTYLVQPGFFDIFFPTDFIAAACLYKAVMSPRYHPAKAQTLASWHLSRTANYTKLGITPPIMSWSEHLQQLEEPLGGVAIPMRDNLRPLVTSHKEFMAEWADLRATQTRSGENPLLMYYENVKFLIT